MFSLLLMSVRLSRWSLVVVSRRVMNTAMWGLCVSGKRCSDMALPGEGVNMEEEEGEEEAG